MTVRHSLISFILKKSDWQSRRHQKAEKKEHLALQSELKSEIERKTRAIQDVREMGIESEKQVCQIEDGVLQCVAISGAGTGWVGVYRVYMTDPPNHWTPNNYKMYTPNINYFSEFVKR